MGRSPAEARSGLRLSVGPETTAAEIAHAIEVIARVVAEVRARAAA
jgi:cysteine sulfinate desulfinase/cysteine desulfurase-like protein